MSVGPRNKSFAQITAEIEDAARKMYPENLKIAGFLCMMALASKRGNASDEQSATHRSIRARGGCFSASAWRRTASVTGGSVHGEKLLKAHFLEKIGA